MTFAQPAEWNAHDWVWIGFPHDKDEWPDALDGARAEIAAFANAVQDNGEQVRLVVRDEANEKRARDLVSADVQIEIRRFGDIWLRDTGPVIVSDGNERQARTFRFNGWGGKFRMDGDEEIGTDLARSAGLPINASDWIFEGGAIDVDGGGRAVTTRQCLLNPNRNPEMDRLTVEAALSNALGLTQIIWLGDGLVNDHTDGHVDNLARFIAPSVLLLPEATGSDDPNSAIYADAENIADKAGIDVRRIASPGRVEADGEVIPASYMNFYISNGAIIVPIYEQDSDDHALATLASCFPDRKIVGLSARSVIRGGGAFHCASQQMPSLNPD